MLFSSSRDTHWHTSLALRCLRAEHSEFLIDSLPFRSTGSLGSTCCQRTPMQARLRACSLLDIFFVLHSLISKHASALKPGVYLFNEASHWNNNSFHCILVFVEERERERAVFAKLEIRPIVRISWVSALAPTVSLCCCACQKVASWLWSCVVLTAGCNWKEIFFSWENAENFYLDMPIRISKIVLFNDD